MFRIRKIHDHLTPANREALRAAQEILKAQFSSMPAGDIDKLPDQLRDPLTHRFVTCLLVAQDGRDRVRGVAVLLYASDLKFCYLETMSAAPGRTGGGVGAALYQRVREESIALGANGLFFECLPDDPALSPDAAIRRQNAARLKFYERFGARPIAGTKYETPLRSDDVDPPYLVFDPLTSQTPPSRKATKATVRAILERKYGDVCPPGYIDMVVASFRDDPVQLRTPRYLPAAGEPASAATVRTIYMVVNDEHLIHHVPDRGYVEAPVRIRSILAEIEPTGLFEKVPPSHFHSRHIRAVHDGKLVDYLERACRDVAPEKSIYPYVFPIRNAARPPKDLGVCAGYFCIDTFTPLNSNAYKAARRAVDCTLSAAESLLREGRLAYALIRPPGHHAERHAFGGFCYFNNSAIAAHYLSRYGRVAVLDIDYHHGNGTQDIFYERADVLTVSIHGHPSFAYPYFSGFKEEIGIGPGAGYNLNMPLPETLTPEAYREALRTAIRRIEQFDPAYVIAAVGFDTAKADPTGTWMNMAADFGLIGRMIGEIGLPTLVVQEGGYRARTLGINARHFFVGLSNGAGKPKPRAGKKHAGKPRAPKALTWRENVREADIEAIRSLVARTGFFSTAEADIAAELVAERVQNGAASGYDFILAEDDTGLVGYACVGLIPGTDTRFDLYWIAVAPDRQGHGIGGLVLARAEAMIKARKGRCIYVDTSSTDTYLPTRNFYARNGYDKISELPDFYRAGDGKVIFMKRIADD